MSYFRYQPRCYYQNPGGILQIQLVFPLRMNTTLTPQVGTFYIDTNVSSGPDEGSYWTDEHTIFIFANVGGGINSVQLTLSSPVGDFRFKSGKHVDPMVRRLCFPNP